MKLGSNDIFADLLMKYIVRGYFVGIVHLMKKIGNNNFKRSIKFGWI